MPYKNDEFISQLYRLSVPLTLQFLFTSSFSLLDTVMVADLGELQIAAAGIAGQLEFLLVMILAGALSGPAVFMAQYYGKRDYVSIKKLAALNVFSGFAISFIFYIVLTLSSPYVFWPFTQDDQLLEMTASFVSIVSFGFIASAVTTAFTMSLKSIGVVKAVMYMTVLSLLLNTVLNYALIYGHFGFEPMGVNGAAVATLISKLLLLILTVAYVYAMKREVSVSFLKRFPYDRVLFGRVYRVTKPIIIHESLWGLGTTMYIVAFGMMGAASIAIIQVSKVIGNFVLAGVLGFAQSASVMIGEQIGLRNKEQAQKYAERFTRIGVAAAVLIGLALFVAAPQVVGLFHIGEQLRGQAVNIVRIMSCVLTCSFLNNIWIVGVFRSGGDTHYSMKLVLGSTWLIGIPLAFIGAGIMKWPIEVVYGLFATEEISKTLFGYFRYRSRHWQHDLVSTEQ
ncbi:MATE family efflux transporter [Cohnella lupini]|uniref:Putative MATE family efflux protein n=1 Tax=Cohnella lupini TaxID=1294267 RepID=A0A3D9IX39_9BACL|nr:MATE family efflux transporter [Cohnella lupini]RED66281.1 putative MATE family efflux protein [Cohnella lupini]